MKKRSLILMIMLAVFSFGTNASDRVANQYQQEVIEVNSFVVVGAFKILSNAQRYAASIQSGDLSAKYATNPDKNLFYVYILRLTDPAQARQYTLDLRAKDARFYDAWVFDGQLSRNSDGLAVLTKGAYPEKIEIENTIESVTVAEGGEGEGSTEEEPVETTETDLASENPTPNGEETTANPTEEPVVAEEGEFLVYVNTTNATTLKEIDGRVEVIDNTRQHLIEEISTHQLNAVKEPTTQSKSIKIISKLVGYRYADFDFSLQALDADSTSEQLHTIGDSIIVDLPLQRLKKGDFQVLWNVYFFKDAAIMRAESISELNSIVSMLNESPTMKIRIHGHTNGNSHGKIVHLDEEGKNFFSMNDSNKESRGSAKNLSEERAMTIKKFLEFNGIAEDRLEVKGWGGKKMIYDKHSAAAKKNVRVEVEVISE